MPSETIDLLATEPTEAPKAADAKPRKRKKIDYVIQYGDGKDTWHDFEGGFKDTAEAETSIRTCDPSDDANKPLFDNDVRIIAVKYLGRPKVQPSKVVVSM